MSLTVRIMDVHAREILDSRGTPTVEAEVTVIAGEEAFGGACINGRNMAEAAGNHKEAAGKGACIGPVGAPYPLSGKLYTGRASVPSGASTGRFEAVELRDKESRYQGKGVQKAVRNVNTVLREALLGRNALCQEEIDKILINTDGTENKEKLGANATLSVSMAVARAAAAALHMPLFRYLGGISAKRMPVPMMNILNGGKHADNTVDFQEFMIMPVAAKNFAEGLRICAEVYQKLKQILVKDGLSTAVGDEGGFAPSLKNPEEVLDYIIKAVLAAGYQPEKDIKIALDVAASELYQEDAGMYYFPGETKALHSSKREAVSASDTKESSVLRSTDEMIALYEELCEKYPIASIEDGLHEDDWDGWRKLTQRLGDKIQLVGDDLFVTNTGRLAAGIRLHTANAILVKVNQIGTLSEAFAAIEMAHKSGYNAVISHRSGETEDTIIADIAVAVNAGQIKTGAPCRTDRVCKYNQLLRIEEELEDVSLYENPFSEKRGGM